MDGTKLCYIVLNLEYFLCNFINIFSTKPKEEKSYFCALKK